jgi:hypothetical protein
MLCFFGTCPNSRKAARSPSTSIALLPIPFHGMLRFWMFNLSLVDSFTTCVLYLLPWSSSGARW